ncbi:hypothetical protein PIROE2DRAFT_11823 [Piromyces sp. E2]|nr:hypothetical protein PIROE2DRAFT_11823 [Piromyces sp. E2]|eukprot:OUM62004.1 hypothetical protein PIROE2DRAFT_11823 [Piromyces sp. E2]
MKFTIPLFILIAATFVLGDVLPGKEYYNDYEEVCIIARDKCYSVIEECLYYEKIKESKEQLCPTFKSDKCQKKIEDCISDITKCVGEGISQVISIVANCKDNLSYICTTDENNQYCPFYEIEDTDFERNKYINNVSQIKEKKYEVFDKTVNESCKSKICSESIYQMLEKSIRYKRYDDIVTFNKDFKSTEVPFYNEDETRLIFYSMQFVKSDYCTAKQGKTEATNTTNTANNNNTNINSVNNSNNSNNSTTSTNQQSSDAITSMKLSISVTLLAIFYILL